MRRSARIENKLREAQEFFNDHPSFALRRDRRRTSYQLASEIDQVLDAPRRRPTIIELALLFIGLVIAVLILNCAPALDGLQ